MRDSKNYVIAALCLVLCVMAVGFAAFSSTLTVNGTAEVKTNWKVKFAESASESDNYAGECTPTWVDASLVSANPISFSVNATNVQMATELYTPGDTVTCTAVIVNKGSLNAKVASVANSFEDTDAIAWTVDFPAVDDKLAVGAERIITITAEYIDVEGGQEQADTSELTASGEATFVYEQDM